MRTRELGSTGLKVTELALGTWGLCGDGYGTITEQEQDDIIERALAMGIRLFDVADSYGKGSTESRLGEHLERFAKEADPNAPPARVVVRLGTDRSASPPRKRFDADFLKECVSKSQERLKRDVLDVVLLHNPTARTVEKGDAADSLRALKEQGAVRAWGVSCGSAEVAKQAIEQGAEVLQLPYNVLHTEELTSVEKQIEAKRLGLLARSVLGYGVLAGYWSSTRRFQHFDHRQHRWSPEQLRERVRQASALRSAFGDGVGTMRAVALRFVLDSDLIASAILGPRSAVQLDQLVREAGRKPPYLSDEQKTRLKNRLQDLGVTA